MFYYLIILLLAINYSLFALEPIKAVKGVRGKAAHIDGYITYLEDTNRSDFAIENGLTVSMWIRPQYWGDKSVILGNVGSFDLLKRNKGSRTGGGFFFWNRDTKVPGSLLWAPKAFPTTLGKWIHIAFTYNQKGHSVGYLNGKKVAVQLPGQEPKGQGIVKIKNRNRWKNKSFNIMGGAISGDVDEVFIYGKVLSDIEIANLAAGKAPKGALATYLMDDEKNIGKDSSGNNRHLKQVEGIQGKKLPLLGSPLDIPAAAANNNIVAYTRTSVDRVFQKDSLKQIKVVDLPAAELAGNEYETFQLVLLPKKQLNKVNITLPSFELNGVKIPVKLRKIGYVRIPKASNIKTPKRGANVFGETVSTFPGPEATPGMYPDLLLPMEKNMVLPANISTGFSVEVKTPSNAPSGIYKSTAIVRSGKRTIMQIPLSIKVRGFSLPKTRHTTHLTTSRSAIRQQKNLDKFYQVMHDYFLSPTETKNEVKVTFDKKGEIKLDTAAWDAEMDIAIGKYNQQVIFLPILGMYGIPKANNTTRQILGVQVTKGDGHLTPEFTKRFTLYLKAISKHLKKKGYLNRTYAALVDEPHTPKDLTLCREVSALIRKHAPGLKIFLTKWPTKETIGLADVWCLGAWQVNQMKAALKRGEKFECYPNWHMLIDRPIMDRRMMGVLLWKHGVSGITHYSLNIHWNNQVELLSPSQRYPNGRVIFGSGVVMYPGAGRLPMPSMRIETIRDALEDYEYFYLLSQLVNKHPEKIEAKEAKEYMKKVCDKLIPCYESYDTGLKSGWKTLDWELDAHVLLKYRLGLMDRIEKLQTLK